MSEADPQATAFVRQFRSWWPYAAFVVLAVLFGGIGLLLGPPAVVLGVLLAAAAVLYASWSVASSQLQADQLRTWARQRDLVPRDRLTVPGRTRLLRAGRYGRLDVGADGQVGGGHGGVGHYSWTVTAGQQDRTEHATLAWTLVPSMDGLARLCLSRPIPGRGLAHVLGPYRGFKVGPEEFQRAYQLEVDDDANDELVLQLFTPELISWCRDQFDPPLWAEAEGGLLLVVRDGCLTEPAALDALCHQLDHLATAWRQLAAGQPID
jgi:hypothetical protein